MELYHVLTVHGISSLKTILKIQNHSFKEQTFFYILSKLGEGEGVSTMSKLSTSQLRGGRGAFNLKNNVPNLEGFYKASIS